MIYFALYLVLINLLWSEFSFRGERLELNQNPWFQRLRWFGLGMLAALILSEHTLADDWLSWSSVLILALGSVRLPSNSKSTMELHDANCGD